MMKNVRMVKDNFTVTFLKNCLFLFKFRGSNSSLLFSSRYHFSFVVILTNFIFY